MIDCETNLPLLHQLHRELTALVVKLAVREEAARRRTELLGGGPYAVAWPGLGEFSLTDRQKLVADELADAYRRGTSPELDERHLVRVAGALAGSRLADVFAGSPAWGTLIVPGETPDAYRLPDPPPDSA